MTQDAPTARRALDPAALVTTGATTLAWYAVPDVVGPRWARALAKTAISAAGAVLTVRATAEGREVRDAVRSARATVRAADGPAADEPETPDGTGDEAPPGVRPAVLGLAAVGAVAVSAALAVAGEKWVYRRGERLRARGVRLPHTRVGLAMAAVAVVLTAVEPFVRTDGEDAPEV